MIRSFALLLSAFLLSGAADAKSPCGAEIAIPSIVDRASVVLFGEIHGTNEIPAFVGAVACQLLKRGDAVQLALEMPQTEQAALDTFLASAGSPEDLKTLRSSPYWQKTKDGRASMAMLFLIERMRKLRSEGAKIRVIAIDGDWRKLKLPADGHIPRDEMMASIIDEAVLRGQGKVLALTGNIHARRVEKHESVEMPPPMGFFLKTREVASFDVAFSGGEANIFGGRQKLESATPKSLLGKPRFIIKGIKRPEGGFDGLFYIDTLTASEHVADVKEK